MSDYRHIRSHRRVAEIIVIVATVAAAGLFLTGTVVTLIELGALL